MSKEYVSVSKWVVQLRSCYWFAVLVELCNNDVWEMQLQRAKFLSICNMNFNGVHGFE